MQKRVRLQGRSEGVEGLLGWLRHGLRKGADVLQPCWYITAHEWIINSVKIKVFLVVNLKYTNLPRHILIDTAK